MVSFDVSALYTNVSVKEAANRLYAGDLPKPTVDKQTFIQLTELSSLDVVMSTHDGYYKQVDGLAMGSPPAPYLANIWLSSYDPTIKQEAKMYQRYMDDILTTIHKNELASKLAQINHLPKTLNSPLRANQTDVCLFWTYALCTPMTNYTQPGTQNPRTLGS